MIIRKNRMKFLYETIISEFGKKYVQRILGHNRSKTTEIYTHVTHTAKNKITSPLDNLDLNGK